MAEDSEKRFHEIMDKLFHAPPKSKSKSPTTSLSGVQLTRGKKRLDMASALAIVHSKSGGRVVQELQNSSVSSGTMQPCLCRPWDRADLLRRLATFKSMTWFAKPKVVSAVNCARRGWVNVESDIIACEACGARLLFSTPSSWMQHHVEKAALVFSLKLDNGHKLLCPWVDNACDEMLVQFPPTPAAVLVDNYKKLCSALLQLLGLPVISSSAIDYVGSPHLEHFVKGSSTMECGNKSADASTTEYLGNECESVSSVLYYQAQKLISLCGWEPRLLPFIVDCKYREDLSIKDANLSDLSHVVSNGQNPCFSVYSSGTYENIKANNDPMASVVQYDPSSVVLDCRLCGASVGLWAFSMAPRPIEFIRLVGYSEVNGENDAAKENVIHTEAGASGTNDAGNGTHVESRECAKNTATSCTTSLNETAVNLKLTIAGGPLPAKQNFRSVISLPVIGRNLRLRFSADSGFTDQCGQSSLQGDKDHTANTLNLTGHGFQLEDMGLEKGKRLDDGHFNSMRNDLLPCLGSDISDKGEAIRNDSYHHMSLEVANIGGVRIPETRTLDSVMENPLENSLVKSSKLPEIAANVETVDPAVGDLCLSEGGNSFIGNISIGNGETSLNDTSMMVEADNCSLQQNAGTDTICSKQGDSHASHGVETREQPLNNNNTPCCIGKDLKQLPLAKAMEFDPIRQHRHFCPWIASSGNSTPGWQQTLSALQRQEEFSYPLSINAPSSSLIEVDDPVASVKKFFSSPSAKRTKLAHGSR